MGVYTQIPVFALSRAIAGARRARALALGTHARVRAYTQMDLLSSKWNPTVEIHLVPWHRTRNCCLLPQLGKTSGGSGVTPLSSVSSLVVDRSKWTSPMLKYLVGNGGPVT